MNSRLFLNLSLLVGVIIIALFIINAPDKSKTDIIKLGRTNTDPINNILIQTNGLPDVQLQRDADDNWQMTLPYQVKANNQAINEVLKLPNAISHSRFSAIEKDLTTYSLKPAKASLHLNDDEYLFGSVEHINKRRYVLNNNTIHLTTDLFYHRLRTTAESFISPQLIPSNVSITSMTLPELSLNQSAKGDWLVSGAQSVNSELASDSIQTLFDHWRHKRAIKILPLMTADNAKDILIRFSDNSNILFSFIKTDSELILIRADLGFQYHLPASAANDLLTLSNTAAKK